MAENLFKINGKVFKKYIDEETIIAVVKRLAQKISLDYRKKDPVFLIVLKGSIFFGADLLKYYKGDCTVEVIRAGSYGESMESNGKVKLTMSNVNIKNKDVIIVEDIVDTGFTLKKIYDALQEMEPETIEAVSFLSKPDQRKVEVDVKYTGMEIEPLFVIGYGLDYAERGRHLPAIYALAE